MLLKAMALTRLLKKSISDYLKQFLKLLDDFHFSNFLNVALSQIEHPSVSP